MSNFDWSKCLFCQHVLAKCKTVCPADSKRADVGHGYASLAAAVDRFRETGCLPPGLKCKDWDECDGIEATCKRRRACWHVPCRQQLHSTKLERLCKHFAADPAAGEVVSCSGEVLNTCDTDTEPAKVARLKHTIQLPENLLDC